MQKCTIRSFVRRHGRITTAQSSALQRLWPLFGLDGSPRLDLPSIFGRDAPCHLEIGFGMGDALVEMASRSPHHDFLGAEVYEPGIGHVLLGLERRELTNVRLLRGDVVDIINGLAPGTLQSSMIFFPDPWPKQRHHKRRLIQPAFVKTLASKLAAGGHLQLATDWQDYAEHMLAVVDDEPSLMNTAGQGRFSERISTRPVTKFEQRGTRLGHGVWDLDYIKTE